MTSFGFFYAKLRSLTLWLIFPFSSPLNWFLFSLDLLGKQFNTRMSLKQQSDKPTTVNSSILMLRQCFVISQKILDIIIALKRSITAANNTVNNMI